MTASPLRWLLIFTVLIGCAGAAEADTAHRSNTVVLDDTAIKNLGIETVEVEENDFETTIFALGRVEAVPNKVAAVSSRIPGRIVDLKVVPGDTVKAGDVVAKIESRQPGDPPPVIPLTPLLGGLVTRVDARLGDPVEPDKALMEITDFSEVYAVARVPEHQAGSLKTGTQAHIRVAALPNQKFDGELLRFGTSADKESGTIDAIFRMPNTDGLLRPEMRAEFSIVLSRRSNVVSVPRSALQGDAATRFVYVKDFDLPNAFIKTPVTLGEMNDRFVEILSGLLPADEVVTRGGYSLSFAGASGISLKEALDAAHGHEHAEDGSELTPEKRAELAAKKKAAAAQVAGQTTPAGDDPFWKYLSGVLGLLLILSLIFRKGGHPHDEDAEPLPKGKEER